MKMIQKNYRTVFPALFLGLMLMFSACQKEEVVETAMPDQELPTAAFKKQLAIQTAGGETAMLEVGASDQALLDRLDARDFSVELNPTGGEAAEETHVDGNEVATKPVITARFLTVQMLGAYSEADIISYRVNFGSAFQDLVRREKIGMRIILSPSEYTPDDRIAAYWRRTDPCKWLRCFGDGGQISTKVHIWKRTTSWQHLLAHDMHFYNYQTCTACHHTNCYRLDDIWVYDDVLSNYTPSGQC